MNDILLNGNIINSNNVGGYGSGSIKSLNKKNGFVIENKTQNITSFIECTNIGVSIVELSPDDIN